MSVACDKCGSTDPSHKCRWTYCPKCGGREWRGRDNVPAGSPGLYWECSSCGHPRSYSFFAPLDYDEPVALLVLE